SPLVRIDVNGVELVVLVVCPNDAEVMTDDADPLLDHWVLRVLDVLLESGYTREEHFERYGLCRDVDPPVGGPPGPSAAGGPPPPAVLGGVPRAPEETPCPRTALALARLFGQGQELMISGLQVVRNLEHDGRAWVALEIGEVMDSRFVASQVDCHITLCYARNPRAVAANSNMVRRAQVALTRLVTSSSARLFAGRARTREEESHEDYALNDILVHSALHSTLHALVHEGAGQGLNRDDYVVTEARCGWILPECASACFSVEPWVPS
ncbi:MAG: hypothetical protein GY772_15460, partial [bacterium]|nr:hypothetical protein [bacterium]